MIKVDIMRKKDSRNLTKKFILTRLINMNKNIV